MHDQMASRSVSTKGVAMNDVQSDAQSYFLETGTYRAEDVYRLLGNPLEGVSVSAHADMHPSSAMPFERAESVEADHYHANP